VLRGATKGISDAIVMLWVTHLRRKKSKKARSSWQCLVRVVEPGVLAVPIIMMLRVAADFKSLFCIARICGNFQIGYFLIL
jgi:hypothetical protein